MQQANAASLKSKREDSNSANRADNLCRCISDPLVDTTTELCMGMATILLVPHSPLRSASALSIHASRGMCHSPQLCLSALLFVCQLLCPPVAVLALREKRALYDLLVPILVRLPPAHLCELFRCTTHHLEHRASSGRVREVAVRYDVAIWLCKSTHRLSSSFKRSCTRSLCSAAVLHSAMSASVRAVRRLVAA